MSNSDLVMALAKVMIAEAWADGSIDNEEINTLKDILFQLPEMTAADWAHLDIYVESPVGDAERERLIADLQARLKTEDDKRQALEAVEALASADGSISQEERAVVDDIETAIRDARSGITARWGHFLGSSVSRRASAAANAPNRELYLDDYTKNKIYYSVSRRLELEGTTIDLPDAELRKLSLAGGLMARVAFVDGDVQSGELEMMTEAISKHWQLPKVQAAVVAEIAVSELSKGMDYYRLSREFFISTSEEERIKFLDVLFSVADSDGGVSYQEIEEIRTIANVQKLTHKQFIDAKLKIPREHRPD